ncbi:hypothetical protein ACU8V3_19190 [Cobetia marina]
MNAFTRISLGVVGTGFLLAGTASANSLMGPFPYDFPARSAETALILYESKKAGSLGKGPRPISAHTRSIPAAVPRSATGSRLNRP